MKRRSLGRTGVRVSELCFGTLNFGWNTGEEQAFALLDAYREAGGNFIQASSVCSPHGDALAVAEASEEFVGRWWRARNIPRGELFFATRIVVRNPRPDSAGTLESFVRRCCDESLRRFRTDHLDLLLVEWSEYLPLMDDVLFVLSRLKRAGVLRYFGAAGFPAWRVMESIYRSAQRDVDRFEVLQADCSLLTRGRSERDQLRLCYDYRLGFLARSPLAGGLLTEGGLTGGMPVLRSQRLRDRFSRVEDTAIRQALVTVAARHEATLAQVALAWVLAGPSVTSPVIGASTLNHLADSLSGSRLRLDEEDFELLGRPPGSAGETVSLKPTLNPQFV